MKMTLLEMVQDILNDLDSDEVNTIYDTVEATQVAQIIKTCYYEMMSNRNWPHLKKLIQLEGLSDLTKPNYLKLPDRVKELITLQYDHVPVNGLSSQYREVRYKNPEDFLRHVSFRRSDDTDKVKTVTDFNGVKLLVNYTTAPAFWTTFDDTYIVFDGYNVANETTLHADKSQALVYMEPQWVMADDFVPDLPTEAFSAVLEEAKSTAFLALKQMANQKAEQKTKRQQAWLSRKAWRAEGGVQYANYGRKGRR